jgi:uncharacterized protein
VTLPVLLAVSMAGGLLGAALLLATPSDAFNSLVPWLLLLATLAFAFGRHIGVALRRVLHIGRATTLVAQFMLAIYGGYFGGAVGIMMMAVWGLLGAGDLKQMSATRTVLVGAMNGMAVLYFIAPARWSGRRHWRCCSRRRSAAMSARGWRCGSTRAGCAPA